MSIDTKLWLLILLLFADKAIMYVLFRFAGRKK